MRTIFKHPVFQIPFFGTLLGTILLPIYGPGQPELEHPTVVIGDTDLAHMIVGWQRTPTRE